MKTLTTILLLVFCYFSSAQNVKVTDLAIDKTGKVSFNYSVSKNYSDREKYQLQVFTSADEFAEPLPLQLAATPIGETKNVSFNGPKLIGDHDGSLQFRFKAEATLFPVRITTTAKKFKSGKNITISWDDFHNSGWYDVELYSGGYISKTLIKNHKGTSYSTDLPKKMEKGTYEIRVTPSNEKSLYSEDYPVTVSSGGAGIFILAGGVLVGAGVFVLGTSGPEDLGVGSSLPKPPDPGGG